MQIESGKSYISYSGEIWSGAEPDDVGHWFLRNAMTGDRARFTAEGKSWSAPGSGDDLVRCYSDDETFGITMEADPEGWARRHAPENLPAFVRSTADINESVRDGIAEVLFDQNKSGHSWKEAIAIDMSLRENEANWAGNLARMALEDADAVLRYLAAHPVEEQGEVRAWLVGDAGTGQWIEIDEHRVRYSRGLGRPVVALAEAFKRERERADAAEARVKLNPTDPSLRC